MKASPKISTVLFVPSIVYKKNPTPPPFVIEIRKF